MNSITNLEIRQTKEELIKNKNQNFVIDENSICKICKKSIGVEPFGYIYGSILHEKCLNSV